MTINALSPGRTRARLSLAHLTVLDLAPPEVARVAAAAGFDHFGLRLNPVRPTDEPYPVRSDTPMRRELSAIMADTGITMYEVEAFRLDENSNFDVFEGSLAAGAYLGARNALCFVDVEGFEQSVDLFGRFCDLCARYNIASSLEFMPFVRVGNLETVVRIVDQVNRSNARILVDALHFSRAGTTINELRTVRPELFNWAQICDAPMQRPGTIEELRHEALYARQFPGEGELRLPEFIASFPQHVVFSPEVATANIASQVTGLERAKRAYETSKKLVHQFRLSNN